MVKADERLVDALVGELVRSYVREALDQLLANKNADVSGKTYVGVKRNNDAKHTPLSAQT
jgi:hypothetical protein